MTPWSVLSIFPMLVQIAAGASTVLLALLCRQDPIFAVGESSFIGDPSYRQRLSSVFLAVRDAADADENPRSPDWRTNRRAPHSAACCSLTKPDRGKCVATHWSSYIESRY